MEKRGISLHTIHMGMDGQLYSAISDAEMARQKLAKARKRFLLMSITLIIVVAARIIVKDPPKPRLPDHSNEPFVALPGLLDSMPVSQQKKLTPQMIAAYRNADIKIAAKKEPSFQDIPYTPTQVPEENIQEKVEYERLVASFEKKRRKMVEAQKVLEIDRSKDTLIVFSKGGHIKAENASISINGVEINYAKGFSAKVPRTMVQKVQENAYDWEEPTPKGFVKLRPAKGITVIVAKGISQRITVLKQKKDDET